MLRRHRRWTELSPPQRALVVVLAILQVALAAAAWTDLARRPAVQVDGGKRTWAAVIALNFVGPLLYWRGMALRTTSASAATTVSRDRGRAAP